MDIEMIQQEVLKVKEAAFAKKTDKQLWIYQELHESYRLANQKKQPTALVRFNVPSNRQCKLTQEQVDEIRARYNPHVYGKKRLAKEYGVSQSVVLRILRGKSWKVYENSG
jgi:hypothetical protein